MNNIKSAVIFSVGLHVATLIVGIILAQCAPIIGAALGATYIYAVWKFYENSVKGLMG